MHVAAAARALLAEGLAAIRERHEIPAGFPAEVRAAAVEAVARARARKWPDHRDLTGLRFLTLDPAGATDLDQAFHLELEGDDVVLRYAIADVAAFVEAGDPVDAEAWRRGVTVYLPDGRAGLYPPELAEAAASLLPDGPRPAVVLTVRIPPAGDARLAGVERAMVASRAKLAYETVTPADLPVTVTELVRRVEAAEERRGATRVEFPDQEVELDPDHPRSVRLHLRPRTIPEDANAAMSSATNLAVAATLLAARTGLFRVQPEPDRAERRLLRRQAEALGIDWPEPVGLRQLLPRLDATDPRHAQFVLSVRRASGGASYQPYRRAERPWHAALASAYAHATAPLRRLADRYVLLSVLALSAGDPVPPGVEAAFAELAPVMAGADQRAARVDREVVDLVEAVVLHGREGEEFPAVVVDVRDRSATVQLLGPAVVARVEVPGAEPGARVRVVLRAAVPAEGRVEFAVVPGSVTGP